MDTLPLWMRSFAYLENADSAPLYVKVTANDYSYYGWVNGLVRKRSGAVRAVVEDDNGRLFIHNVNQLEEHEP